MTTNAKTHRVLIVEDSPTIRELIRLCLRNVSGLEYVEANNGAEALQHMTKQPVDVVLLDLNMPVMDGFQFLEQLNATLGAKAPPIIVVTTQGDVESIMKTEAAGVRAYLTKPLQASLVADTVKSVLKI